MGGSLPCSVMAEGRGKGGMLQCIASTSEWSWDALSVYSVQLLEHVSLSVSAEKDREHFLPDVQKCL